MITKYEIRLITPTTVGWEFWNGAEFVKESEQIDAEGVAYRQYEDALEWVRGNSADWVVSWTLSLVKMAMDEEDYDYSEEVVKTTSGGL